MQRNFGLDILRCISIWLVLLQHAEYDIPGLKHLKIGVIGVEVFFVLSGFLIGGILWRELDKQNSFGATLKTFWTRRWMRILPLYYGVLLFKFIFIDHSIGWNILYYIGFLQNNFYGINYFSVSWSLVIEEWFYIVCPIFLLTLTRFIKTQKGILISLSLFVVFINLIRFIYVYKTNAPFAGVNGNFPFRFDSLFLGVILAFLNHKRSPIFSNLQKLNVCIAGFVLFSSYLVYFFSLCSPNDLINQSLIPRTLGFFTLAFSISLMVPYIAKFSSYVPTHRIGKALFTIITQTSILTYGIYLLHPFAYDMAFGSLLGFENHFIKTLVGILLAYAFAWLVYQFYEKPILKLRDKIS